MGVTFIGVDGESYAFEFTELLEKDGDVLIPFAYMTTDVYKITYFILPVEHFQYLYDAWVKSEREGHVILKDQIPPIRIMIQDVYNESVDDYQLIELLSMDNEKEYRVIDYRYLGQLVERPIMERIIDYYIANPDPEISRINEFLKETEFREMEIKFKKKLDFSSDLLKYNEETQEYEYDDRLGIKKILGFEENDYTSEEFAFRRFPKSITDVIVKMVIDTESAERLGEAMEKFLLNLAFEGKEA